MLRQSGLLQGGGLRHQVPWSFGFCNPPKQKELFTHPLSNLLCPYGPSIRSPSQRETAVIWAVTAYCVLGLRTAPPPLPLLPSTFGLLEEEVRALRGAVPFPASTAAGQGWNPDAWISGGAAESFPHLEMLRLSPHSSSLCEFVYCLSSSLEGQSQVGLVP